MSLLNRYKCRSALAIIGILVGVSLAQVVSAEAGPTMYHVDYGDKRVAFCSDGGLIETMSAEVALGEKGWNSPEEAVQAFEDEKHRDASNPAIPQELRDMLGPTRTIKYLESADKASDGEEYFDIPSPGAADLEARVTVTRFPGDGWKVTGAVHCMSVVVTDMDEYNRIAEEIYKPGEKRSDPGEEFQP